MAFVECYAELDQAKDIIARVVYKTNATANFPSFGEAPIGMASLSVLPPGKA